MSDFLDKIQQTQSDQAGQRVTDERVKAIIDAIGSKVSPNEVRILGSSIDTLNSALEKLGSLNIDVKTDEELKSALSDLSGAVKSIEINPIVKVPDPKVIVKDNPVDLSPLLDKLSSLEAAIKANKSPKTDNSSLESAVKATTDAINGLSFPAANFILPFKGINGGATQVQLDASGNVPISGTIAINTTGLATSAKQDTGNTSLSSIDGKITAVNTGAVVVSSSVLPTGAATAAKQPVLGTAGSASADVLTVQGKTSMTPLLVDGSATTQPVSLASVPSHAVTNAGTFAVQTTPTAPTSIFNGNKTVTTAGTRVTLASSQAVKSVVIKALVANTGTIYVGDSSVASTTGFALSPGDTVSLDIANLSTVNLDSSVSGEGVTYIGTN